jgi:hypothetical protein
VNKELEKNMEESPVIQFEALAKPFPAGTKETNDNLPQEIRSLDSDQNQGPDQQGGGRGTGDGAHVQN